MSRLNKIQKADKHLVPALPAEFYAMADTLWEPLARLRGEFDRIFDDFPSRPFGVNLSRRFQAISGPAIEFKDKGSEYEMIAEVPGLKTDDIELKVSNGVLRLSGERKDSREGKENGFLFSERHYGRFDRAIKLPKGVDPDKISASAQDGILSVHMPKTKEAVAEEKKIPISTS